MSFKDISYQKLWQPLCSVEYKHLCNFGRRQHEKQFCETILNLAQWLRGRCRLKIFLELCRPLCSVEQNHLCNFGRRFTHDSGTIDARRMHDRRKPNTRMQGPFFQSHTSKLHQQKHGDVVSKRAATLYPSISMIYFP